MKKMLVSAAAALLTIGIAMAGEAPEVKEGLWSIHRQTIDNPGNKKSDTSSTICRNHAYDQHVQALAKNVKGCTRVSESFQGGKLSTEMHCVVAGTVIDTRETATYQGDTSTHAEIHTTYTPAFAGVTESTMIMDQKYIGSCPAGAQPGDMTSADGSVNHLWKH